MGVFGSWLLAVLLCACDHFQVQGQGQVRAREAENRRWGARDVMEVVAMQTELYEEGRRYLDEEGEGEGEGEEEEFATNLPVARRALGGGQQASPAALASAVVHQGSWHMDTLIEEQPEYLVITFSTPNYMVSARSWYNQLVERGVTNHWVVVYKDYVLDEELDVDLKGQKMRLLKSTHVATSAFKSIMSWRVHAITHLLKHNVSVLAADTDTIWLKNPLTALFPAEDRHKYDMIVSYGSTFPGHVHLHWGHVICMGMVYIRAGKAGIHALKRLNVECDTKCDDQQIMNHYLALHSNVTWANDTEITHMPIKGGITGKGFMPTEMPKFDKKGKEVKREVPWKFYDGPRIEINVKMIPEVNVQRRYVKELDYKNAYVLHPILPKVGTVKISAITDVIKMYDFQKGHSWTGNPADVSLAKKEYNRPLKKAAKAKAKPKVPPLANLNADVQAKGKAKPKPKGPANKPKAKAKAKPKDKAQAVASKQSSVIEMKMTSATTETPATGNNNNNNKKKRRGDGVVITDDMKSSDGHLVVPKSSEEAAALHNAIDFKKAQKKEKSARADASTILSILGDYGKDIVDNAVDMSVPHAHHVDRVSEESRESSRSSTEE